MEEQSQPTRSAAAFLTLVSEFILRFVVISEEEVTLLAVWVLHGYVLDACGVRKPSSTSRPLDSP